MDSFEPVFLSLGSNLGDRMENLRLAVELLAPVCAIKKKSSVYETAAWGKTDQPDFLNIVIEVATRLTPLQLLHTIQETEKRMGRERNKKWEARTIDIDVLYFKNEISSHSELIVPHPYLAERKFVLVPLAEINPDFIHPLLQLSNAELLSRCKDQSEVRLFTN
ncbi:MAG: 2-amino-4-hydroxy-6-hydroxymethyldihydropteridine diphosphokinase [Bacteroidetes bacterium]|nr:2-amino-4-hydroxy-6-hydroxymethyldihydropteridine diphosphokinase [Bacteroidota bacterium]MBS1541275.1 2-amino-4-hydroxy-6-hydroxymethyldihydropteridine diphosphokinase [Bacteroidota bacterium]